MGMMRLRRPGRSTTERETDVRQMARMLGMTPAEEAEAVCEFQDRQARELREEKLGYHLEGYD